MMSPGSILYQVGGEPTINWVTNAAVVVHRLLWTGLLIRVPSSRV